MIQIYTKPDCSFCDKAKKLLVKQNLQYIETKIGIDIQREDVIKLFPTAKTVPIILIDNTYIGGYTELNEHLKPKSGFQLLEE